MGRIADAWAALTGKSAPGEVFGDPKTLGALHGLLAGATPFGVPPRRGERELMVAQKRHPVLHSITRRIGYDLGATNWKLYVARGAAGPEKRWSMRDGTAKSRLRERTKASGALRDDVQELTNHPLLDLLHRWNPIMTGYAGLSLLQTYLDLKGEAFIGIERNRAGMPVQLWPIPGYWVFRTPYFGSPAFHCNFGTWVADVPETDVLWPKHLDPENPYWRGSGTAEALGDELEIDEYAAKVEKEFFYNQAIPAGIASIEGLGKSQLDRVREDFAQGHVGIWNAMRLFWTGSKIDFKQLSPKFADSEVLELRKDQRDKIVQTYGVPPEILGIAEHSNRATSAAAKVIYVERVLAPRLEFLRNFLQERLVPEFDDRLVIDYVDPTPDDQAFKLQAAMGAPWALSQNEWRELQGLPPLDGKDAVFLPLPSAAAPATSPIKALRPGRGGDPAWALALPIERAVGGDEDAPVGKGDIEGLVKAADAAMLSAPTERVTEEQIRAWIRKQAEDLGVELDFELVNPKVGAFLREQSSTRIKGLINETTRSALRETLGEGVDSGEGIRELKKRIRSVFEDAQGYRAANIARTETTRAAGWANRTAYEASGVVSEHEWIATRDSRTRDDHAEMDGQRVDLGDSFTSPNGETAAYPGDFGDPAEDCNCRCTTAPVVGEPKAGRAPVRKAIDRDAAWKAFDSSIRPWEEATRAAFRAGFAKQRAAVLDALDGLK